MFFYIAVQTDAEICCVSQIYQLLSLLLHLYYISFVTQYQYIKPYSGTTPFKMYARISSEANIFLHALSLLILSSAVLTACVVLSVRAFHPSSFKPAVILQRTFPYNMPTYPSGFFQDSDNLPSTQDMPIAFHKILLCHQYNIFYFSRNTPVHFCFYRAVNFKYPNFSVILGYFILVDNT